MIPLEGLILMSLILLVEGRHPHWMLETDGLNFTVAERQPTAPRVASLWKPMLLMRDD